MRTRILSGIIMLPLLVFVFIGGNVLLLCFFLIGIMGLKEFYNGFDNLGIKPSLPIGLASTFLLYSINLLEFEDGTTWYMFWVFAVVLMSLLYLFKIEERKLEDGMVTALGVFYVVFFSYHIILVEQLPEYGLLVWLIFLTAFGTDSMAYFAGYFFGKHKLCPSISPKKTIEGSIGGIAGSVILCGVFAYFVMPFLFLQCIVIGIMGGIVSQFGDLTASLFKRKMGIKDFGNLIPGHGGILDRIDSLLFTAPFTYYYIMLMIK